jgi:hypothetical protein
VSRPAVLMPRILRLLRSAPCRPGRGRVR